MLFGSEAPSPSNNMMHVTQSACTLEQIKYVDIWIVQLAYTHAYCEGAQ